VVALFTPSAAGQSVEAEAPWLTVYDDAGRPKWELRMERLLRTPEGWRGEAVQVFLYHEGAPLLVLRAPQIHADRFGREWTLTGGESVTGEPLTGQPVTGEGEGFAFACREARWSRGLVLTDLTAEGRDVSLSAAEARWWLGESVELFTAEVTVAGWRLRFATGRYDLVQDVLVTDAVTATGHGVTVVGTSLTAWPREGRLQITEAHLARGP